MAIMKQHKHVFIIKIVDEKLFYYKEPKSS